MSRRRRSSAHVSEKSPAPSAEPSAKKLPPADPRKPTPGLLYLSLVLFAGWILFLAYTAYALY